MIFYGGVTSIETAIFVEMRASLITRLRSPDFIVGALTGRAMCRDGPTAAGARSVDRDFGRRRDGQLRVRMKRSEMNARRRTETRTVSWSQLRCTEGTSGIQ